MIEDLRRNLEQEKKLLREIDVLTLQMNSIPHSEREMYMSSVDALKSQLKMLNDSVPLLLQNISMESKEATLNPNLARVPSNTPSRQLVTVNKEDRERYNKEIQLSKSSLRNLGNQEANEEIKKPSLYVKVSNTFFRGISEKLASAFSDVGNDLREANMNITLASYLSLALFTSLMLFIFGLLGGGIVYFLQRTLFIKWFWVFIGTPIALPLLSGVIFYINPASQKGSVKASITNELPFVTIYMAAIANSNVESTQLFKIISRNEEYPAVAKEMLKVINQIEIYGLDLVTSLRNAAKKTTNPRLSELFNGLATNIVSGGSLKNYLEKKSENFLLDYKLERQRYSSLAETFMDVYISILVAAPLILILLLIVMNSTKIAIGLPFEVLATLTIGGVALINVIFMVVVHVKQPTS